MSAYDDAVADKRLKHQCYSCSQQRQDDTTFTTDTDTTISAYTDTDY